MTAIPRSLLNLGYGTGNPNGFPDFKPLNPHGRPMPRPEREVRRTPVTEELWQIHVITQREGTLPVGPKMPREALEPVIAAMRVAIAPGWSNPHLVRVPSRGGEVKTIEGA